MVKQKTIAEELAENEELRAGRGANRLAVLAKREEIMAALGKGYCLKDVYDLLVKKRVFEGTYHTFRSHWKRIEGKTEPTKQKVEPASNPTAEISKFTYDSRKRKEL